MSNLPSLDSVDRKNAPWRKDHEEPDGMCPHCEIWHTSPTTRTVETERVFNVLHILCPGCDGVLEAKKVKSYYGQTLPDEHRRGD